MGKLQTLLQLLLGSSLAAATTLVGAGTYLPTQVLADMQFAYRFANPGVDVDFYGTESQAGICRLESFADKCDPADTRAPNDLDFAVSIKTLNQSDYDNYTDIQMYPVLATAIVPVYNLRGVRNLVLTRTALAQIFSGQITTWDDSRITTYNANFSKWNIPPNQRIEVVVRKEDSDVTLVYKSAMYAFSATFATYVDVSSAPTWGPVNVTMLEGFAAVNTYVMTKAWTISYTALQNAVDANLPRAQIWKGTNIVVDASVKTTTFALLELGLAFGNNGDDPSRLTADLNYARGVNGWPIVTYVYAVLRTKTLRDGATCDNVHETVAFWQWFLTAGVVQSIAESHYFVQPPAVVRDLVVQRLVFDVMCLNQQVFQAPPALQVMAAGETIMAQALSELAAVYAIDEPQMSLQYTAGTLNTSDAVAAALASNQFVAVQQPSLAPASGTVTLLFAGVAVVVVSQYDVVLDLPTLVRILDGDITGWLHPDILALNPNGFQDANGAPITNASQRIGLVNGPTWDSGAIRNVIRRYVPTFTGKALQAAYKLRSEGQVQTVVAGIALSLGVSTSAISQTTSRVKMARLQRSPGVVLDPTPAAILACARSVPFSATDGLELTSSSDAGCYPLSFAVYLVASTPQCDNASGNADDDAAIDAEAAAFLTWVFTNNNTAEALEGAGVAMLADLSPAVTAANTLALSSLSCSSPSPDEGTSASSNIIPAVVGACIGALVVIGIPVAWYVRKSNRDMRALQKQVSDVKVAEDCAEAIACFDLDAVSWLAALSKPTKIQLAFLRIVSLLVEVKPFIPDQLMAQLQAAKNGEEPPKADGAALARQSRRGSGGDHTDGTSQSQLSLHSSSFRSGRSVKVMRGDSSKSPDARRPTSASDGSSGVRRPNRAGRGSAAAGVPGNQNADRYRRTCTYMYVRFVIKGEPEADKLGQLATTVAAHVVTLGKAHGATIDKVTYDSVALHWNVSTQCSGAPLQATSLAMELACSAQIVAPELQSDLQLLVGIGHGPSTVATVSAAGQRFFVVGGPEIANAVDVVMREVAVPLGCTILLSNAVQQEVKFGFRCSPRVWFRDVLFWEPMEKRGGCKVEDEWMYQIKHMEQDDSTLDVNKALSDVFALARSCQSIGVLQREVRHVQQTYAAHLTPQDLAALRNLHESSAKSLVVSAV